MSEVIRNIELLAPAKDIVSAIDAIDCGADAIYMGGARFGARYAAGNTIEDIARAAEYAHRYGAKIYATCNTLLFDEELDEARQQALALCEAGVDALIVQDMAYCRMGLPIALHASTQTNSTEPTRVRFFEQTGFERAILERSLSIDEIREIRRHTNIELEAFIHGAICVCHSGRCFLSRSTTSRSGNRGECSQPCRLTYDLTDGKGHAYIKGRHLLSVRDLDLSSHLGEMLDAGINSFKIEGRLKDRVYLRNTVSHYRHLLDEQIALREDCRRASVGTSRIEFEPDTSKSFTRGASDYFFCGKRAGVSSFDTPKSVGESIARIAKITPSGITLDRDTDLATGDGICYIANGEPFGTNINAVEGRRITPNKMDGMEIGMEIFRNHNRIFATSVERSRIRRAIPVTMSIDFGEREILLSVTDEQGVSVTVTTAYSGEAALNDEKMRQTIRTTLSKSGDTSFDVTDIEMRKVRFVPASVLTSLRRTALEAMLAERMARHPKSVPFVENRLARYPDTVLTEQDNVTNALAHDFYADHGAVQIAEGLDCRATTEGCRVMVSDYCIRREIGECLLEKPSLRGELYLERGRKRYRLDFDCKRCRMSLIDNS